jgi:hypothetical protein
LPEQQHVERFAPNRSRSACGESPALSAILVVGQGIEGSPGLRTLLEEEKDIHCPLHRCQFSAGSELLHPLAVTRMKHEPRHTCIVTLPPPLSENQDFRRAMSMIPTAPIAEPLLLPHHRQQLQASGLTEATIRLAGFWSETDAWRLAGYLKSPVRPRLVPALGIVDVSSGFCFRPDRPRMSKGKVVKYESPRGQEPRLYFAPSIIAPGDRWRSDELVLTEGIKKALCVAQEGYAAISAQGVYLWHDVQYRNSTGKWRLHHQFPTATLHTCTMVPEGLGTADVRMIQHEHRRRVYIAFDGWDTSTNADVIEAEFRLVQMLRAEGADVRLVRIPYRNGKVGIDDFLAQYPFGPDRQAAMQWLLATSIEPAYRPGVRDVVGRIRAALAHLPAAIGREGTRRLVLERLLDLAVEVDRLDLLVSARRNLGLNIGRETLSVALSDLAQVGWIRRCADLDRRGSTCWELNDRPDWASYASLAGGLSLERRELLNHDAWSRRSAARDVYRLLLEQPRTFSDVQVATQCSRSVVFGHLRRLREDGLARKMGAYWYPVTDTAALDVVALNRGTAGAAARRSVRSEQERRMYRASRYHPTSPR